jgi:hypothetical protein
MTEKCGGTNDHKEEDTNRNQCVMLNRVQGKRLSTQRYQFLESCYLKKQVIMVVAAASSRDYLILRLETAPTEFIMLP